MNINDYLSSSAKYFLIGSVILFVSKIFNMLTAVSGGPFERFAKFGSSTTNFVFYAFLVIAYIALNGEGIAHKRTRNLKHKRVTSRLKWLIAYNIFFVFFKTTLNRMVFSLEAGSPAASAAGLLMGMLSACASLSFFLFVISLWYFVRDKAVKSLSLVQTVTVIISVVYFLLKFVSASLLDYRLGDPDSALCSALGSAALSNTLCLVQYAADIIMLIAVKRYYSALSAEYDANIGTRSEKYIKTVSIYNESGFGIDECDDLLLPFDTQDYIASPD